MGIGSEMKPSEFIHQRVESEIVALHKFLGGWLNGTLDKDDQTFEAGIRSRLAPNFSNIQPAGTFLTGDTLLAQIYDGHGKSPGFDIRIDNVRVIDHHENSARISAVYEEYQKNARNSDRSCNARISTVLFQEVGQQLTWLHIHETWMPEQNHAPDRFDF